MSELKKYQLKMQEQGGSLELEIYDYIGEGDSGAFPVMKQLRGKSGPLTVHMHTAGGYVDEGRAIYSLLKEHNGEVTVKVEGLAASMGSFICMAADRVVMSKGSTMMIHNPWMVFSGDSMELRKAAAYLDEIGEQLAGIYAARSGQPLEAVKELMAATTYMTPERAVELGFADEINEGRAPRAAACATWLTGATKEVLSLAAAKEGQEKMSEKVFQALGAKDEAEAVSRVKALEAEIAVGKERLTAQAAELQTAQEKAQAGIAAVVELEAVKAASAKREKEELVSRMVSEGKVAAQLKGEALLKSIEELRAVDALAHARKETPAPQEQSGQRDYGLTAGLAVTLRAKGYSEKDIQSFAARSVFAPKVDEEGDDE